MRKNDLVTLKVTDLNNLGMGVARLDSGQVVFVSGAADGDVVEAKIIKIGSDFCVARIENTIEPSAFRVDPDCSVFKNCGGCVYRHISYEHELELKRSYVENVFRKHGFTVSIPPVLSGSPDHYRNKVQYPFAPDGRIGCFASRSHRVVPFESEGENGCLLQDERLSPVANAASAFFRARGVSVYDEETGKGILRHLCLRIGKVSGQILLMPVVNADKLPFEKEFCEYIVSRFPAVKSIVLNVNKEKTNVITGKTLRVLYGKDYIEDNLCGVDFRVHALSFYQVNHDMAEVLYKKAAELALVSGTENLLDLFCGVGTVGLSMKKFAREKGSDFTLRGVEIVAPAVEMAKENARLSGLEAEFLCADANVSDEILDGVDTVVVDPPRSGVEKNLIEKIAEKKIPRVVYISCSAETLGRDCRTFADLGYRVHTPHPVDLFPRTGHVECVCLVTKLK